MRVMTEPVLFGFPITLLFLYFIIYSFLGWIMETTYCSIVEKRFVARGFLYGPICPIYGVGVLMMICWFAPLTGSPFLFYVVATAVMSAWEYFVGWFLEATTHIKYWDYSMFKFNLNGRICLWVCLMWGVLAYAVIYWVHPLVSGLVALVPPTPQHIVALVLLVLLAGDAAATIRELALVGRLMAKLDQTGEELRLQLTLGRAELTDKLDEAREAISDRLDGAKEAISDKLDAAKDSLGGKLTAVKDASADAGDKAAALRERYDELLRKAERTSRHLRYSYSNMTSKRLSQALSDVAEASRARKAERQAKRAERREARRTGKGGSKAA